LRRMEVVIRPRWHTPFQTTKRLVGLAILLLAVTLIAPFPFNILPTLVIMLISFAYWKRTGSCSACPSWLPFFRYGSPQPRCWLRCGRWAFWKGYGQDLERRAGQARRQGPRHPLLDAAQRRRRSLWRWRQPVIRSDDDNRKHAYRHQPCRYGHLGRCRSWPLHVSAKIEAIEFTINVFFIESGRRPFFQYFPSSVASVPQMRAGMPQ
jgi:hypothetical protein